MGRPAGSAQRRTATTAWLPAPARRSMVASPSKAGAAPGRSLTRSKRNCRLLAAGIGQHDAIVGEEDVDGEGLAVEHDLGPRLVLQALRQGAGRNERPRRRQVELELQAALAAGLLADQRHDIDVEVAGDGLGHGVAGRAHALLEAPAAGRRGGDVGRHHERRQCQRRQAGASEVQEGSIDHGFHVGANLDRSGAGPMI